MDGPAKSESPVENGGKHPIILKGFQASFWWCRISQPSTVVITNGELVDQNNGYYIDDISYQMLSTIMDNGIYLHHNSNHWLVVSCS